MQKVVKVPTEHEEAKALVHWMQVKHPTLEPLLIHLVNEGKRSVVEGARKKKEGMRKGIPDYLFAYPSQPYHGLFIELKRRQGGRVSKEQHEYLAYLASVGYRVEVAKGWEEAAAAIEDYLSGVLEMKGAA